jgi:putative nucleotidyltransferase with HDIG domain
VPPFRGRSEDQVNSGWWEGMLRLPAVLAVTGAALLSLPGAPFVPLRLSPSGLLAAVLAWTWMLLLPRNPFMMRPLWPLLALGVGMATFLGDVGGVVPPAVLLPLLATLPLYPVEGLALLALSAPAILWRHWSFTDAVPWEITAWAILVAATLLRHAARDRRQAATLVAQCVSAVSSQDDGDALRLLQRLTDADDVALLRGDFQTPGVTALEQPFIWLQGDCLRRETALVGQGVVQLPAAFPRHQASMLELPAAPGSKLFISGGVLNAATPALDLARLIGLREAQRWMTARLRAADYSALESLVQALDARDPYTRGHSERVAAFAVAIGEELGLATDLIDALQRGGMLHDIGKIGIPEAILQKPSRLTADEYAVMQRHVKIGVQIIDAINSSTNVLDVVSGHHEHHNGTGYPRRLQGDQIPLLARIAHVADSFEAMTSARSYTSARPLLDGIAELRRCAGTQFHPDIVEAFIAVILRGGGGSSTLVV